jgi:hypothetical protein
MPFSLDFLLDWDTLEAFVRGSVVTIGDTSPHFRQAAKCVWASGQLRPSNLSSPATLFWEHLSRSPRYGVPSGPQGTIAPEKRLARLWLLVLSECSARRPSARQRRPTAWRGEQNVWAPVHAVQQQPWPKRVPDSLPPRGLARATGMGRSSSPLWLSAAVRLRDTSACSRAWGYEEA